MAGIKVHAINDNEEEVPKFMMPNNWYRFYGGDSLWQRTGKGTNYFRNGQIQYQGDWVDDKYHGYGRLFDESGNLIYKGKFHKNKMIDCWNGYELIDDRKAIRSTGHFKWELSITRMGEKRINIKAVMQSNRFENAGVYNK